MKFLEAKILDAYFQPLSVGLGEEEEVSYEVLEFENGLIQVQGDITSDWFFDCRQNIEGNGNDMFVRAEDTGRTVQVEAIDLVRAFGGSVNEFDDLSCAELVKELAH